MRRVIILGFLLGWATALWAQPAEVILLRHGEKPENPQALHLAKRGEERAKALPEFFARSDKASRHGPPVALFASRPTRRGHGQRPRETLEPLAKVLRLPIQTPYESEDYARLARDIMRNPSCRGKTVVVCWVHEFLPQFAAALGVKPEPPKWKDEVYDRAYIITFEQGQANLDIVRQKLLPGDSRRKE